MRGVPNPKDKLLRVREPVAVRHPETGEYVVPTNEQPWQADDPIVKAYPWLFITDEDAHAEKLAGPPESVRIETVRQSPGGYAR